MKLEDLEQIAIIDYFSHMKNISSYIIHIRNEAKRTAAENKRAKRMGLKKGVSDLFIAIPKNGYAGFFLELKAQKTQFSRAGKATKHQLSFLENMKNAGYKTGIFFGAEEAISAICDYLQIKCYLK